MFLTRLMIAVVVIAPAIANAEPAVEPAAGSGEVIIVVDRKPDAPDGSRATARDRMRALTDAPFVTIVHPDDHPAAATVADALATTVGVQTTSLGGAGAYESISVRGAAPGHTEVLIDGIPLARIASVTTDLGRFELGAFGQVELYRGAVPIELGGAGVGGALNLITRLGAADDGARLHASIGVGSFGARHLRVHYGDSHFGGRWLSSTTLGYQGATGNFSYYNDNGTPLNLGDDTTQIRHNNGFDQVDGASRVGTADGRDAGGLRASWKQQGLPGTPTTPSLAASLVTLDVIGDARGTVDVGPAIAQQLGYVLVEDQQLHDPLGELGLGTQERRYVTVSGGASSTWKFPLGGERGAAGLELRGDHVRDEDTTGMQPAVVGTREGGAISAAIDVALDDARTVVFTPAIRLDVERTAPSPEIVGPDALAPLPPRWDVVPSPRLGGRVAITPDLSIKGSGGEYIRLPTLVEIFGDRGYILGAPELLPEHGPSADLGAVWAPAAAIGPIDRVFVEVDGFLTRAHDTIAFVRELGFVSRAINVGDTESQGAELTASARVAHHLSLTASYTQLATTQLTGDASYANKQLPREPTGMLYARAEFVERVGGHACALWIDTSWQALSYLDQANLQAVPARTLVGSGARVELGGGVALAVNVQNLANVRVEQLPLVPAPAPNFTQTPTALADVAGFPLPGRSFYLSLDWTH